MGLDDIRGKLGEAGIEIQKVTIGLDAKTKTLYVFHKTGNNGMKLCDGCFKKLQYLFEKTLVVDAVRDEKKE